MCTAATPYAYCLTCTYVLPAGEACPVAVILAYLQVVQVGVLDLSV